MHESPSQIYYNWYVTFSKKKKILRLQNKKLKSLKMTRFFKKNGFMLLISWLRILWDPDLFEADMDKKGRIRIPPSTYSFQ